MSGDANANVFAFILARVANLDTRYVPPSAGSGKQFHDLVLPTLPSTAASLFTDKY